jgi:hypothetical protein
MNHSVAMKERSIGICRVEAKHREFIGKLRKAAISMLKSRREITADDLRQWATKHKVKAPNKNCWGAIFNTREFVCRGRVRSVQPSGHGNCIGRWSRRQGA